MQHLSRTLFTLFFIMVLSACPGWAQRSLTFEEVEVNDAYSISETSGTIYVDYSDTREEITSIFAAMVYNQAPNQTAHDYTIELQVTYTDEDGNTTTDDISDFASISSDNLGGNQAYITGDETDLDYPLPIKIKAVLHEDGGTQDVATTGEIIVQRAPDPNLIGGNAVCFNPTNILNCNKKTLDESGGVATNIPVYGTIPTGGGPGGVPPGGYIYQWQVKYDNGNWMDIPGGTDRNHTLASTSTEYTYLRRKVSSSLYPDPNISEEITLHLSVCARPTSGICADQYFYNCTHGQTYGTRSIMGAAYNGENPYWKGRTKVIWDLKEKNGEWDDHAQSMSSPEAYEFNYGAFTKKTDRPTDVYFIRRRIEWRNCFESICGQWHAGEESNEIKFVFSVCSDPVTNTHTMWGPSSVKCTDNNLIYTLNISTDCGVENVQWFIPSGWTFLTQSSGQLVRNVRVNPFNGLSANGGTVKVRITYVDGKVFEKQMTVSGQTAPTFTSSTYALDVMLCEGQPQTFTVTAAGGTAPYTCEWVGPNTYFTPSSSGNSFSATVSPIQPGGVHKLKAIISDNNGCKVHSNEPSFHDGTALWTSRFPWGVWTNLPAANITPVETEYTETVATNIISEQLGNIYYVAKESEGVYKLATIRWDPAASTWRNFTFPRNRAASVSSSSIGIIEPTEGTRTIFFVGLDKKLRSITSINGYQNEYTYVNNWTAETIYAATNDVKDIMCVNGTYVIYKNSLNHVYAYDYIAGNNILVDASNVEGIRAAIRTGAVYYIKNGQLFGKNINNPNEVSFTSVGAIDLRPALYNSDIEVYGQSLYFVGADNYIRRATLNDSKISQTVSASDPTAIQCSGFFSLNKNTGVIYFTGTLFNTSMNQLFNHPVHGWKTKQISNDNQAGAVKYRFPNAFYVGEDNAIKFTYFAVGSCMPGLQREDFENEDYIEGFTPEPVSYGETELSVYPSPATGVLNVNVGEKTNRHFTFVLTDLAGKEIRQWENESGHALDISNISGGIYLVSVYDNDVLLGIQKVVITE